MWVEEHILYVTTKYEEAALRLPKIMANKINKPNMIIKN